MLTTVPILRVIVVVIEMASGPGAQEVHVVHEDNWAEENAAVDKRIVATVVNFIANDDYCIILTERFGLRILCWYDVCLETVFNLSKWVSL